MLDASSLLHGSREDDFLEQDRKEVNVSDQNQIIQGAGVGDDEPHRLQSPKLFRASRSRSKSSMV